MVSSVGRGATHRSHLPSVSWKDGELVWGTGEGTAQEPEDCEFQSRLRHEAGWGLCTTLQGGGCGEEEAGALPTLP